MCTIKVLSMIRKDKRKHGPKAKKTGSKDSKCIRFNQTYDNRGVDIVVHLGGNFALEFHNIDLN